MSLMVSPQMFNMQMLILPWPRALFLFTSILKIAELQKIYSGQTITSKKEFQFHSLVSNNN